MTTVHLDEIKQEMVLSEDVIDVTGRLLLQKGHKIKPSHVNIIKKWGITEVNVVGDSTGEEIDHDNVDFQGDEEIDHETLNLFQHTDLDHPATKELYRLAILFKKYRNIPEMDSKTTHNESETHHNPPKKDIRKKISQKDLKMPEIPSIVLELNEILSNPLSTADNLAQVVSKSPSLTAVLLRIVNSSYYGFTSRIDTITRAVTMIGTREISSLALVICTISVFKHIPRETLDMHAFLRHSFTCGLISRMMAANRNIRETEQLFVSGLLHDIGRLVVYSYFPQAAKSLLIHCQNTERMLLDEETRFLGYTHTDISRFLLQEWNFPSQIEDSIFYHHDPMASNDPIQATIVHLSDIVVNALGIGSSGERYVPPLNHDAWENLGLSPSSFEVIIRQAIHQLSVLEPFLQS